MFTPPHLVPKQVNEDWGRQNVPDFFGLEACDNDALRVVFLSLVWRVVQILSDYAGWKNCLFRETDLAEARDLIADPAFATAREEKEIRLESCACRSVDDIVCRTVFAAESTDWLPL